MKRHYLPSLKDTKAVSPMDRQLSDLFLQATLIEIHEKPIREFTAADAKEMKFFGQLMFNRLQVYGRGNAQVSFAAVVVALAQCKTPGDVVLWAFTLNRINLERQQMVTVAVLADVFPWGFPNEKGKEEVWDAQKISNWGVEMGSDHNDNMLDHVDMLTDTADPEHKQEWCKWLKT